MDEKEISRRIGQRIQKLRREKGYTQVTFSEKIGISNNYLSDVERGLSTPGIEKFVAIMDTLECSADDLFCDVIHFGVKHKATRLEEQIEKLSEAEQRKVAAIIEALLETK